MNPFARTLEHEQANNNPIHSLRWVATKFKETGLYEHEPITFANTHLITEASSHFKKYGIYTDIDPKYDKLAWDKFWDRWEYRRKKGMTLNLKVPEGGANSDKDLLPVWIPGKMVGILNFGPIIRTKDEDEISTLDAEKATKDQLRQQDLTRELEELISSVSVNKVADTTYDFMDFWDGHFQYWVAQEFSERIGLDLVLVKARRKGFSYIGAWDAWDEVYMNPRIKVFLIAYESKYLTSQGGLYNLVEQYFDFEQKFTDWRKGVLYKNKEGFQFGYTYAGQAENYGFQSSITCYSAMDNADVLRGKQAKKIKWEEMGTFPNADQTREIAYSAAEAGGYKLGHSTYWGTAGSKNADYGPLRNAFYNPTSFEALPFNNVWDNNKIGTPSGMFFGQYQNLVYDKNGNTDFEAAKAQHRIKLLRAEANKSASQFAQWNAERATVPADALNRQSNNIFARLAPRIQLQIDRIETDKTIKNLAKHGKLIEDARGVRFITNSELKEKGMDYHPPIEDTKEALPKEYDLHGCVTVWFPPHKIEVKEDGTSLNKTPSYIVPAKLYYIWHDPYATDKDGEGGQVSMKDSLGVAYVYEKTNGVTASKGDRLVASLIGRPDTTDAYNEQLLLLAKYYNTIEGLLFENDRGEVFPYFKTHKALKYLMEEPEMLTLKELSGKTGRRYGISIGKNFRRISEGARMMLDHFSTPMGKDAVTGLDLTFIEYIYCKRLLKEILRWSKDGNFDCVSACIVGQYMIREVEERAVVELLGNNENYDDFFERQFF